MQQILYVQEQNRTLGGGVTWGVLSLYGVLFDKLVMMLQSLHSSRINTSPLNWHRARDDAGIIWQSTFTHRTTLTVLKGRDRLRWNRAQLPSLSPWVEYGGMAGVTETENLCLVLAFLSREMQWGYSADTQNTHNDKYINTFAMLSKISCDDKIKTVLSSPVSGLVLFLSWIILLLWYVTNRSGGKT